MKFLHFATATAFFFAFLLSSLTSCSEVNIPSSPKENATEQSEVSIAENEEASKIYTYLRTTNPGFLCLSYSRRFQFSSKLAKSKPGFEFLDPQSGGAFLQPGSPKFGPLFWEDVKINLMVATESLALVLSEKSLEKGLNSDMIPLLLGTFCNFLELAVKYVQHVIVKIVRDLLGFNLDENTMIATQFAIFFVVMSILGSMLPKK